MRSFLGMASLGALFASLGDSLSRAHMSAESVAAAFADIKSEQRRTRKSRKHRGRPKPIRITQLSEAATRRARIKRRWEQGFPIPDDDREALEAAQLKRQLKNARRSAIMAGTRHTHRERVYS